MLDGPPITVVPATADLWVDFEKFMGEPGRYWGSMAQAVSRRMRAMAAIVLPAKQENIRKMIAILEENFDSEGAPHGKRKKACMDAGMSDSSFARGLRDMKEGLVVKQGDGQNAKYRVAKLEAVSVSPGVKPMS